MSEEPPATTTTTTEMSGNEDQNNNPSSFPDDTAQVEHNPNEAAGQETPPSTFQDDTAQVEHNPNPEVDQGTTVVSVPPKELPNTGNTEPLAGVAGAGVGLALAGAAMVRAARRVLGKKEVKQP